MYAHPIKFLELLNGQVQYVVPRWQRRYCWDQSDIERLVEDLVTISAADSSATHYGGTLLTFPDPGAAGVVTTIRVVDGQQRLTTVSILLACIAAELGPNGECNCWTRQIILDDRLTNPGKPPEKLRKLRLQDEDEEEYRRGLAGEPAGAGAVSQAWRIARRLVAKNDIARLLTGIERLRVVTIGLDHDEDPQQIFESLNATGRPLTESEKVKNWLLMGFQTQNNRIFTTIIGFELSVRLMQGTQLNALTRFFATFFAGGPATYRELTESTRDIAGGLCNPGKTRIGRRFAETSQGLPASME